MGKDIQRLFAVALAMLIAAAPAHMPKVPTNWPYVLTELGR